MRIILTAFAALLGLTFGTSAHAGIYKGFYYGSGKAELVHAAQAAYERDSTGTQLIDAAKCGKDGSCATLKNYLDAFRAYDPEANLTSVSQISGFIESLVEDCTVHGDFLMARIKMPGAPPGATEVDKMHRQVLPGECVLRDLRTGRVVIALHCANPVGKLVTPVSPCDELMWHTRSGDRSTHVALMAGYDQNDTCWAIKRPGDRDWQPLPKICDANCYYGDVEAYFRRQVARSMVIGAQTPGTYTLRVPKGYAFTVLCLERANGMSLSVDVDASRHDYRPVNGGSYSVATVYYDHAESRVAKIDKRRVRWFAYPGDQEDPE